ncbi:lysoplasmalogenase [Nocardioidaceae bacterium]|nr:lysoplasmalogenase [Nocardioidaceae bacterium]
MKPSRRRVAAYIVASTVDAAIAGADRGTWQPRRWATKPLLMPLLMIDTVTDTSRRPHALTLAQTATWAGDVLLMRDSDDRAFRAGIASFAVAHLAYTAALLPHARLSRSGRRRAAAVTAVSALGAVMLRRDATRTRPDLANAVAAYSLVIGAMGATAAAVPTDRARGRALRAGAVLFMASDLLIGVTTFTVPEASRRLETLVMATYTAGQLMLDRGITELAER